MHPFLFFSSSSSSSSLCSTFVCPTEIIAFSDRAEEFRKINTEVIGVSTDSHFTHLAWINTPRKQGGLGELNIPLLADKSMKVSRDYGVLDEETGIPFRGLYIIDANQKLRQVTVNVSIQFILSSKYHNMNFASFNSSFFFMLVYF